MERTEEQRQDVHSREGPSSPGNADIMRKKKHAHVLKRDKMNLMGSSQLCPGGLSWRGFGWKTGFPYACIISHVLASADLPAAPPAANCKGY